MDDSAIDLLLVEDRHSGIRGLFLAFCGYLIGFAFTICAFLKPLFPEDTGLWVGPNSINAGFLPGGIEGATEILGPWFIQAALLMSVLFYIGTTIAVRALLPRLRQSRRVAAGVAAHAAH